LGDTKRFNIVGRLAVAAGLSLLGIVGSGHLAGVQAAEPISGTVSQAAPTISWHFDPVVQSSPITASGVEKTCPQPATATVPSYCDNFALTVDPTGMPAGDNAILTIDYKWDSSGPLGAPPTPEDMDVFAFDPSNAEFGPGSPDSTQTGPGEEVLTIAISTLNSDPKMDVYNIRSIASTSVRPGGQDANATATLKFVPASTGGGVTPPSPQAGDASFTNYPKNNNPFDTKDGAGEVSIGADWSSDTSTSPDTFLFQDAVPSTYRVDFTDPNNATPPTTAKWTNVTFATQNVTFDPIGYQDHPFASDPGYPSATVTGYPTVTTLRRLIVSQLYTVCSDLAFTDDDGSTYTQGMGCPVPAGVDHQTIGGGPYHATTPPTLHPAYPHAIYYCSQNVTDARCGRSDNGGLTFGPAVTMYPLSAPGVTDGCGGIHGHVRVAPDGTVFVPNKNCTVNNVAKNAVLISTDNSTTPFGVPGGWTISQIPDSKPHSPGSDPSVAVGADPGGTNSHVYFGYQQDDSTTGGSHPQIAVSLDDGKTWKPSIDVGKTFGIQNIEFPEVIAGDGNRAAFAFAGTTSSGSDQVQSTPPQVWHEYVAFTYDGGSTWTTVDATPTDPIQRGAICTAGTTCSSTPNTRNLLDFQDITIDRAGRVEVAYSDGCIDISAGSGCVSTPNPADNDPTTPGPGQYVSLGTIARQNCSTLGTLSKGLMARFDASGFPGCSANPTAAHVSRTSVTEHGSQLTFRWSLANRSGIAGFNLDARSHQLNGQLIPVHASHSYRFTTRYHGAGPYVLHVVHRDGSTTLIPLR